MGIEECPFCGHLTLVYRDAGLRQHEPDCPIMQEQQRRRDRAAEAIEIKEFG